MTEQVSYGLDWLRGTMIADNEIKHDARNKAQKILGELEWLDSKHAPFSYREGVECKYAGIHWHEEHPEFGLMWNSSGAQLSAARAAGIDPVRVLNELREQGWKMTRLDLAMDIYNAGGRPREMFNARKDGDLKTKSKHYSIVQSRDDAGVSGETVYFGARQSKVYIRVYDKAAERGKNGDCIRVEIELKQDRAESAALSVYEQGLPRTMASILREQFLYGLPDWITKALELQFELVKMELSKDTNFEKWFQGTVIPAIEKAVRTGVPDAEAMIRKAVAAGRQAHGK